MTQLQDRPPPDSKTRSLSRRLAVPALVIALLATVFYLLVMPRLAPHQFSGSVMQSNTQAPPVELIDQNGDTVRLTDFGGQIVVMYFGYTYCPDLCPTTLAAVDQALNRMGDGADEVQVVMVSVDPDRDSPEALGSYLANFNDDFIGLTGSPEDLIQVATVYGVAFQAEEGDVDSGYLVNHTANLIVIDKEGFLKLVMPPLVPADDLAADLEYLL